MDRPTVNRGALVEVAGVEQRLPPELQAITGPLDRKFTVTLTVVLQNVSQQYAEAWERCAVSNGVVLVKEDGHG